MKVIQDVHDYNGELLPPAPSPDHAWNGEAWVVDTGLRAANLAAGLLTLCAEIDREADSARAALSGDALRALEHQRASEAASAFLAAGAPQAAVPEPVQAWVTQQRNAREAAKDIVAQAERFSAVLLKVRTLRLQAKERIRVMDDLGQARACRDEAVEALRALRAVTLE